MILIIILCQLPATAYAGWSYENGEIVLTPDSFTEDGKIKLRNPYEIIPELKISVELPNVYIGLPNLPFIGVDGKKVDGVMTYPNIDDIEPGTFYLQWVFTPNDDKYETVSGVFEVTVYSEDSDISKGIIPTEPEEIDEPTPPSLTATTVLLMKSTSYDINVNNKVSGAKFKWTSSNPSIAKVNPKNGLVTAVSEGTATIACIMSLPDGTEQTLYSVVYVEHDDNATVLSDTELNLEVGDKYTLKVENAPAGAKYKFTTSDKAVVKVGTVNGKVTAVSPGEAYITCTITADNQVIVLRCNVTVE